ncbi:hypothetical protein PGT21_003022 [Puccinia graminis f. sp. tritici]|uniref:Uncharacterized protein n=1 Tax=Puccinia graminis f. sp. tritici TaxID=56615 RepID=A0A5B0NK94_PUCGR|nr:hypothetical protein PGT21_003022 [Puccinia graminis f. sp. tritici]
MVNRKRHMYLHPGCNIFKVRRQTARPANPTWDRRSYSNTPTTQGNTAHHNHQTATTHPAYHLRHLLVGKKLPSNRQQISPHLTATFKHDPVPPDSKLPAFPSAS